MGASANSSPPNPGIINLLWTWLYFDEKFVSWDPFHKCNKILDIPVHWLQKIKKTFIFDNLEVTTERVSIASADLSYLASEM